MAGLDIKLAFRGDLRAAMAADVEAGRRAAMRVMRERVTRTKNRIRAEVLRGGLGKNVANAVRGEVYPQHAQSLDPTGRVWSKAIVKRRTGSADLILAFSAAREIVAKDGRRFLAIPTQHAGRFGRRRREPGDFPPGFLRFVPVASAGSFVAGARGGALLIGKDDRVYFVLVRRTRLAQRINPDALTDDGAGLDAAVVAEWELESAKTGERFGRVA